MFWNNYVGLCIKKGEAPNAVAEKLGVKSSGTVTGWKNGAAPRAPILRKIADYFEVSVEDLLSGENGQKKEPATITDNGYSEVDEVFKKLSPENREKLLELARLYLDAQRNQE